MTYFYVQRKPEQPTRKMVTKKKYLTSGTSIPELLEIINSIPEGIKGNVSHYTDYSECCDETVCDGASIEWEVLEDEESYEKRLASYNERLAKWEAWYLLNKEKVDAIKKHEAILDELRRS